MFNYNNYRINEIDFILIETEYIINIMSNNIDRYDFLSNKNNSYSVYFKLTEENDIKISNDERLSKYTILNEIPTIFFSLTKRQFSDDFDDIVDKKEQLEIMGKVIFIILEYIKTHTYTTYSIGEVGEKKINFYNYYRKYFKEFEILTGKSKNYNNIAYYLIKKENDKLPSNLKLDENTYLKIK